MLQLPFKEAEHLKCEFVYVGEIDRFRDPGNMDDTLSVVVVSSLSSFYFPDLDR